MGGRGTALVAAIMTLWQGIDPAISEKEAADDFVDFTIGITETFKIITRIMTIDAILRKWTSLLPASDG